MAPTQADFVRAVMAHLGMTQTQLGIALQKGNAYQTVHGWLERKRLGYTDTMRMLEMCGWLSMDAEPPSTGEEDQPTPGRPGDNAVLSAIWANLEAALDALGVPESERKRLVLGPTERQDRPASATGRGRGTGTVGR